MTQNPKPASPQPPVRARRAARAAGERIIENASAVFLRAGFRDAGFLLHWPAIAGPHIARVAQPVKWQETQAGAVLTLRCEPGAAVLLQHETRTLVEKCNAYLGPGRIARLKLVPGALPCETATPPHPAPDSDPRPDKIGLTEALERLHRLRGRLKGS
jgi:hypothetical protein